MASDPAKIAEIFKNADAILATARQGLSDIVDKSRTRRLSGLHNIIVFGRSVSFVVQNLKSAVDGFDEWYAAEQQAMKGDPVLRFMVDARNEILKQGKLNVGTAALVSRFSTSDIGTPPPGALGFFLGDELGGSGWRIRMPNGEVEKYYVDMPEGVTIKQFFADISPEKYPELVGRSVDDLAHEYIEKMDALLQRARAQFLPRPSSKPTSHLRLVKG